MVEGKSQSKNTTHPHLGAWIFLQQRIEDGRGKGHLILQLIVDPTPKRLKDTDYNNSFGIETRVLCLLEDLGIKSKTGHKALLKVKAGMKMYN